MLESLVSLPSHLLHFLSDVLKLSYLSHKNGGKKVKKKMTTTRRQWAGANLSCKNLRKSKRLAQNFTPGQKDHRVRLGNFHGVEVLF